MRLAGVMALVVVLFLPVQADAAYPGQNGKIAYAAATGLKTMNPDGTGQAQLTTGPDSDPVWSPDGQRVAFVRQAGNMRSVHVVNADGTGETPVTSPVPNGIDTPTWSSDGQRIAFSVTTGGQSDIWVVNVDGSGLVQITNTPAEEAYLSWSPDGTRIAYTSVDIYGIRPDGSDPRPLIAGDFFPWPDWSPNGQSMVFATLYDCDGDTCLDIVTRRLDGSGGTHVIGSNNDFSVTFDRPSWSPDGTRIVLGTGGDIITINPNGTGRVNTGVSGSGPDWQPLPVHELNGSHIRPKSATPFRVPLVPAAKPCAAPNRQHGPPLAFGSCNPPQSGSSYLTAGVGDGSPALARSTGSVRLDVQLGAPGPPEDSDVTIRFSLTNVMRASDLSEYTGELRSEMTVRGTDRDGLTFTPHSTSTDVPFGYAVPCTATPESSLDASSCVSFTSVNAVIPGAVKDTNRAVWALDALRVYDGGPDEDADTEADNALFMTQGVFVP